MYKKADAPPKQIKIAIISAIAILKNLLCNDPKRRPFIKFSYKKESSRIGRISEKNSKIRFPIDDANLTHAFEDFQY
jgi:hypothetical protein